MTRSTLRGARFRNATPPFELRFGEIVPALGQAAGGGPHRADTTVVIGLDRDRGVEGGEQGRSVAGGVQVKAELSLRG